MADSETRKGGSARRSRWTGRERTLALVSVLALVSLFVATCSTGGGGVSGSASDVIKQRNLSDQDVVNAVSTYTPSGVTDEYIQFASGGQSGQVFVIGVPSMRLLRTIGVFTPEPWQGYGYGDKATEQVLAEGDWQGKQIRWGDTHHPALSETAGDYDGQNLFINDKANARVAVIDLRDFQTKQIVKNPLTWSDHGGSFVTPNTEWVIEGGQYAQPLGFAYQPLSTYKELYRGMITMWKFDRTTGRIDPARSFAMELPPYFQDLCDAGKLESEGLIFCNSFNTELATGGTLPAAQGGPGGEPMEKSTTVNDMDYLHVIDVNKAAEAVAAGKSTDINGMKVIPLAVSNAEGLLHMVPEPKSPHGADVTPNGKWVVVSGKLDPHVTVYGIDKIKDAIANKNYEKNDPYGVPVLNFDATKEAQVELGLGPLHTQFDDKGYAYTSLFLDSAVARWSLGGDKTPDGEKPWSLVNKEKVQYNIGHLSAAEGDTVSPDGKYLVALNKWSIDRFFHPGPLFPQNFQLLDISQGGKTMPVMYDMPIGVGEPHYTQIIKADKLHPVEVYPDVGWDPMTWSVDPNAPKPGTESIVRDGNNVTVNMTVVRSHFTPDQIELKKGDNVTMHLTNIERAPDATHGFAVPGYNINLSLEAGEATTINFVADKDGVYPFYCTEFCSALHLEMAGYMTVAP
ncbi:MAG: Sec-dependent nitrous-oxide reductase [Acidimicrobiia bacterium]